MFHAEDATRIVAALGLLIGFAFAVPPASAEDATDLGTQETSDPVCIPFTYEGETGPVSYTIGGCGDVDASVTTDVNPDEDPTEQCSVTATEDPQLVLIECRLSTASDGQTCIQIYWKFEVGPVTWERSGCDGELSVDDDWRILSELGSSSQNCPHVYWKVDAVVVVWEQRSACEGDIYVKDGWQP